MATARVAAKPQAMMKPVVMLVARMCCLELANLRMRSERASLDPVSTRTKSMSPAYIDCALGISKFRSHRCTTCRYLLHIRKIRWADVALVST